MVTECFFNVSDGVITPFAVRFMFLELLCSKKHNMIPMTLYFQIQYKHSNISFFLTI